MRVLELYCGIGGCAAALEGMAGGATVVAAVDVNRAALAVYRHNFDHPVHARAIESLEPAWLRRLAADLWWLSPPCQPYTRRGKRLDDADPRARSLLAVIDLLAADATTRPRYLALENVPEFAGSRSHQRLRAALEAAGYRIVERTLCPSELGVPNRRRRFFLLAARDGGLRPWPRGDGDGDGDGDARAPRRPLHAYLDPPSPSSGPSPALRVPSALAAAYQGALDVVDPGDTHRAGEAGAVTACFTAAYGRSPVRSGSYLRCPDGGLRRFSPAEVLRLLGFPSRYELPGELPPRRAWPLLGNSLSVDAVRTVLAAVPELS